MRLATSSESSAEERMRPQRALGSAHRPEPEGPAVDELDVRREPLRRAIGVERSAACVRDRARRRRGAGALGAFGEQLGVALVEAGDGVAEAVGGEDLGPPASSLGVDLDQDDLLSIS